MSQKKIFAAFLASVLVIWIKISGGMDGILLPSPAFAQMNGVAAQTMSTVALLSGFLITVLQFLMWTVFWLLDLLMDPNIIFNIADSGDSSLIGMLRELWQF